MAEFDYDAPTEIGANTYRIVASNPSPMTGRGTNSYLVGSSDFIAIDPGPDEPAHIDALIRAAKGRLRYVVVTHTHRDHAPGAMSLCAKSGATLLAFSAKDEFSPNGFLTDGDVVRVPGASLQAIHTPGHSSDHLCYLIEKCDVSTRRFLFSGDHVLGGTTTAIIPPDGDMSAYLRSLENLLGISQKIDAIAPGHGDVIDNPRKTIEHYIAHRIEREEQVLALLSSLETSSAADLSGRIYRHLPERLERAARATVWAHLRKLKVDGRVTTSDADNSESIWSIVDPLVGSVA